MTQYKPQSTPAAASRARTKSVVEPGRDAAANVSGGVRVDGATGLLFTLTDAVSRAVTLDDIYEQALEGIRAGLGVERASILTYDDTLVMKFRAWRGISADYRDAVEGHCPWAPDARDPQPILVEDTETAPGFAAYLETFRAENIAALAFIPLVYRSRLLGKFMLYYEQPHRFSSAETSLATMVARQVAFAVARKVTEVELEQTREKLSLVLRGLADAVTAQSPRGELLFANPAGARLWNCASVDELLATPAEVLAQRYELIDEAGNPLHPDKMPGRIALATGRESEAIVRFRDRCSNDERWFLVKASPAIGANGEVLFAVNLFRDITNEQRILQAEQRATIEAQTAQARADFLADASKLLASSLEYTHESLARLAQLAVPKVADWCVVVLVDRSIGQQVAIAHSDPAKVELAMELRRRYAQDADSLHRVGRVIATGKAELYPELNDAILEKAIRNPERLSLLRELSMCSAVLVPMTVAGRVLGAIALASCKETTRYDEKDLEMVQSLAERAALAIENARLYAEAKHAVQTREDFLAIVSHDLRNPLSVILLKSGFLKMDLAESASDPRFLKDVEAIARAGRSMERLIRDLFDLSSIEAGRLNVDRRMCIVLELLQETMEAHRPLMGERTFKLESGLIQDNLVVSCDRDRILQVFSNLIGNATKFTAANGDISIGASIADGSVVFFVKDNGIGMSDDDLAHAFHRYGRGRTAARRGLGLGLYIAKALIEAHKGQIWIESVKNKGTVVRFSVPLLSSSRSA